VGTLRQKLAGMIATTLIMGGCATDSGFSVCRAKSDKELAAEKQANVHESLAKNYRLTNDQYYARYHEQQGMQARLTAVEESNILGDMIFAVFANCDR
jgi:hypothetical protein